METREKPEITLTGTDSNAFSIMSIAVQGLRGAGYTPEEIKQYKEEAMSGDYNNLLRVTYGVV